MADNFAGEATTLNSPAVNCLSITPNDSADIANVSRALYVGAAGDVKITTGAGDTVTIKSATAGSILPIRVRRVFATGSDGGAGDYIGLY